MGQFGGRVGGEAAVHGTGLDDGGPGRGEPAETLAERAPWAGSSMPRTVTPLPPRTFSDLGASLNWAATETGTGNKAFNLGVVHNF